MAECNHVTGLMIQPLPVCQPDPGCNGLSVQVQGISLGTNCNPIMYERQTCHGLCPDSHTFQGHFTCLSGAMVGMSFCLENSFTGIVQTVRTMQSKLRMSLSGLPNPVTMRRSIAKGLGVQYDYILDFQMVVLSGGQQRRLSDRDGTFFEEGRVDELWLFAETRHLASHLLDISIEFSSIVPDDITIQAFTDTIYGLADPQHPAQQKMASVLTRAANISVAGVQVEEAPKVIAGRTVVRDENGIMLIPTVTTTTTTTLTQPPPPNVTVVEPEKEENRTGAIVAGAIGGVIAICLMASACIYIGYEEEIKSCVGPYLPRRAERGLRLNNLEDVENLEAEPLPYKAKQKLPPGSPGSPGSRSRSPDFGTDVVAFDKEDHFTALPHQSGQAFHPGQSGQGFYPGPRGQSGQGFYPGPQEAAYVTGDSFYSSPPPPTTDRQEGFYQSRPAPPVADMEGYRYQNRPPPGAGGSNLHAIEDMQGNFSQQSWRPRQTGAPGQPRNVRNDMEGNRLQSWPPPSWRSPSWRVD